MNVKNLMGVAVGSVMLASCTGQVNEYTVHGEVVGVEEGMVYLKRYDDKHFTDVDSARVSGGHFTFKGSVSEPLVYGLTTVRESRQPQLFFLENGNFQVRLDEDSKKIEVSGSPVNDLFLQNRPLVDAENYRLDSLVQLYPASPVGPYFFLKNFSWRLNLQEMKSVREMFAPSLANTVYVKQIDALIAKLEQLQPGAEAPDFSLPDVDGNPVSLSDFRGKFVLVDFWASWCPDCRKENPNIVAAFQRFNKQNFTVLSVSLDRKREPWLAAIEKDNLTWTHVSDLKDWSSEVAIQYGIRWIPTSYLIDPDGVILAVGLEGDELMQKLEEVLKVQP